MSSTAIQQVFPFRSDPLTGAPMGPPLEVWSQLSPSEQTQVTWTLIDAYAAWEREAQPGEGTPHAEAQRDLLDRLRQHFGYRNQGIFFATNLLVQYPQGTAIAPDLIAVLEVPLHHRFSWQVAQEGKGPDLALEFLFRGNPQKDLRHNVVLFAELGIAEYFVFDGERRRFFGWRLATPEARRYTPIVPQGGLWASEVLGVSFAVLEGALRVYHLGNEVQGSTERIAWLNRLVNSAEVAAEESARRAEEEARRAEEEAQRAAEETRRADAALAAQRQSLRAICAARGVTLDADAIARIERTEDAERLATWIVRAATGGDQGSIFAE